MGQRDEKYLLSGIVELDDGYVGGPSHNGKRGRGTEKAKIVVAVSKAENGMPLFARMKVVENVQGKTLQEIIDQYFAPQTKVECDGYRSYMNLEGVELNAKRYETNDLHWLHKAISNLKAFLLGTYHGRCTNLQAYLGVNPKFCVNAKLWCKIEQKYFKAGAAQAAAAFSTKITALRGDVKGGGVSLRSSRLLTFRLQPVSPACGRQRTPPTVRELRSSPAAFRSTSS